MLDALDGTELTRMDLGDTFRVRFGQPYCVIHRNDLHGLLLDACRTLPDVALETGRNIVSFEQDAGSVVIRCDDGTAYEGSALIGADGLRSVVRSQLLGDGVPRVAGQVAYRGVVPVEAITDRTHANSVVLWVGHNMHMVQYRLRGGAVMNTVAVVESEDLRLGLTDTVDPGMFTLTGN